MIIIELINLAFIKNTTQNDYQKKFSSEIMRRPQNLKKSPTWFLLSSVKTSWRFFQTFVAFSEKLDFKKEELKFSIL